MGRKEPSKNRTNPAFFYLNYTTFLLKFYHNKCGICAALHNFFVLQHFSVMQQCCKITVIPAAHPASLSEAGSHQRRGSTKTAALSALARVLKRLLTILDPGCLCKASFCLRGNKLLFLLHPKLKHPYKSVRIFLLERIPMHQIPPLRVIRKHLGKLRQYTWIVKMKSDKRQPKLL